MTKSYFHTWNYNITDSNFSRTGIRERSLARKYCMYPGLSGKTWWIKEQWKAIYGIHYILPTICPSRSNLLITHTLSKMNERRWWVKVSFINFNRTLAMRPTWTWMGQISCWSSDSQGTAAWTCTGHGRGLSSHCHCASCGYPMLVVLLPKMVDLSRFSLEGLWV